jgi:hypothetical protein
VQEEASFLVVALFLASASSSLFEPIFWEQEAVVALLRKLLACSPTCLRLLFVEAYRLVAEVAELVDGLVRRHSWRVVEVEVHAFSLLVLEAAVPRPASAVP